MLRETAVATLGLAMLGASGGKALAYGGPLSHDRPLVHDFLRHDAGASVVGEERLAGVRIGQSGCNHCGRQLAQLSRDPYWQHRRYDPYRQRRDDPYWQHRRYGDQRYIYRAPAPDVDRDVPLLRHPPRRYLAPGGKRIVRLSEAHVDWCFGRYRSYRTWDNSFQPYHGPRRPCISPYYDLD